MTVDWGDDVRRAGARPRRVSAGVLADRMAATLVHHEPGWRLPRLTALARRFNVSAAEIDAAIDDLAARHLLRCLPDGQVYRASPAEYRVPLEGLSGLTSHVDPMGGKLVCKSRQVSRRRAPEDIGRSLGVGPGDPVLTIRCLWTVGGDPAALSATYLPERMGRALPEFASSPFLPAAGPLPREPEDDLPGGGLAGGQPGDGPPAGGPAGGRLAGGPAGGQPDDCLPAGGLAADGAEAGHARALQIEMAPPPPSVARSLRLSAGEPVATVTVSFEDPAAHSPVALTMAMLRPDLFRIVVQATTSDLPDAGLEGSATFWTHAAAGWEP
jgi:DNA-binding GntR family transcriptional regulator